MNPPSLLPNHRDFSWPQPALERMMTGISQPLTLLVSPAGSGKTRLLHRWKEQLLKEGETIPLIWLTLEAADNFLNRFLADLSASLAMIQEIGDLPEDPEYPEMWMIGLINALAELPRDFVLILDNYHLIESAQVHEAMSLLLDYMPPKMHLVIASRSEPHLPIPRMRARRQLVELGPEYFQN